MECKSNRHDSHLLSEARAEPPAVVCSALLLTKAASIEYHIIRQIAWMHCTAEKLCGAFFVEKIMSETANDYTLEEIERDRFHTSL